jgi:hypothetical protein
VRDSTTADGLVALLTFLAETRPTRWSAEVAASSLPLPAGALVVTTSTAVATLPSSFDHGSVVVVE